MVRFQDPTFHAQLEITDIVIQSTTPEWTPDQSLKQTRYKIPDEDSVVIFKMVSWSSLKLEGWSTSNPGSKPEEHNSRIRLLSDNSKIKIAFKKNLSTNSIMSTKVSVFLGDIIWILTQSQLRAVSKLSQSLTQAAVKMARAARLEREKQDSDRESIDSVESTASTASSEVGGGRYSDSGGSGKADHKKKPYLVTGSKSLTSKERIIKQRITDYREGKHRIPHFEVIQDSFHLHSGKIEIQLCDDMEEAHATQGSMLLQLCKLVVDVYFDQPAGVGRAHWNEANDNTKANASWSKELIQQASKTQFMDFPSIGLIKLRERGVVIRCSDFSVSALKSGDSSETLPVITCDKKTFNIPDDEYNPAFQVGLTFYHYPLEYSEKFSAPRPNVFVYISPLHINVDQLSCLWLVRFVYGVVRTVNMELAVSVHDEGKSYIESQKAESVETHQLPGVDAQVRILFTKVTVPLPGEVVINDGRPKALQVEIAAIIAKNRSLESLLSSDNFKDSILAMKRGWVFETQDTDQFPHFTEDIQSLPSRLRELIDQAFQRDRSISTSSSEQRLSSEKDRNRKLDLATMEGWYLHTDCVQVSFAKSYSHEATLHTTQFVDDFPVHLWLFPPRPDRDSTLSVSTPSTPSHSPQPCTPDPIVSFVAYSPNLIRAELNRAQVLFLMRLKDSITMFKNKLMEFLDTSNFVPPRRTPSPSAESQTSSNNGSKQESTEDIKAISGCVIVEHLQANLLLPSIFTIDKIAQSPTTPKVLEEVDSAIPTNESSTTITDTVASEGTTQPKFNIDSDQASTDLLNPTHSLAKQSSATSSNSSLTVNIPASPALIGSSEFLDDYETGSVSSLPVISSPGSKLTREYNSASNLASMKSSSSVHSKSPSSISLSALPDSTSIVSPSPIAHITASTLVAQNPSMMADSVSSSLELKVSNSQCSSLDDFVLVKDPLIQATGGEASEVRVTLSPPTEQPVKSGDTNRRLKSPPPLSERKVRSLSPPKSEPEYILCIKVDGIHAIPNILTSGGISARCNANSIDIREIKKEKYEVYKEESKFKKAPQQEVNEKCAQPVIKARLEIGDQVARFFADSATTVDAILILKASNLDVGLLTQNMAIMKDFFDDEFESDEPIPMHIRVDNTKLVILDSPGDSIDHWKSVCVEINQADIHRGKSLAGGVNIFMDGGHPGETKNGQQSSSSEKESSLPEEPTQEQCLEREQSNTQLLNSFKTFISSLEFYMKLRGHQGPIQHDHITDVLSDLHTSDKPDGTVQPPPPYSEAISVMVTTHLQSASSDSNSEVIRLRRENEELRQLQFDRNKLNSQLVESQSKLEQNVVDFEMVTEECMKAKESLVAYKQTLEKQHETLERLLLENSELKRRLGIV